MAYSRREVQDHVTVMNKDLYDNLQDGIDELKTADIETEEGLADLKQDFSLFQEQTNQVLQEQEDNIAEGLSQVSAGVSEPTYTVDELLNKWSKDVTLTKKAYYSSSDMSYSKMTERLKSDPDYYFRLGNKYSILFEVNTPGILKIFSVQDFQSMVIRVTVDNKVVLFRGFIFNSYTSGSGSITSGDLNMFPKNEYINDGDGGIFVTNLEANFATNFRKDFVTGYMWNEAIFNGEEPLVSNFYSNLNVLLRGGIKFNTLKIEVVLTDSSQLTHTGMSVLRYTPLDQNN